MSEGDRTYLHGTLLKTSLQDLGGLVIIRCSHACHGVSMVHQAGATRCLRSMLVLA